VVGGQAAQTLRDLRDQSCGSSVSASDPGNNGRHVEKLGQLRECPDSGFQPSERNGSCEFDDPRLKIDKRFSRQIAGSCSTVNRRYVLRIDLVSGLRRRVTGGQFIRTLCE
jgi:hypothetical protein